MNVGHVIVLNFYITKLQTHVRSGDLSKSRFEGRKHGRKCSGSHRGSIVSVTDRCRFPEAEENADVKGRKEEVKVRLRQPVLLHRQNGRHGLGRLCHDIIPLYCLCPHLLFACVFAFVCVCVCVWVLGPWKGYL